MKNFLVDLEFTHLNIDHSLFQKELLFIAVYIDDLLLCSLHKQQIQRLKNALNAKFEMMNQSFLKHYLGMQITHNRTQKTLTLTQSTYLQKVLRDYRFKDVKSVFTSMKFRIYLSKIKHFTESRLIHDY